MARILPSPPTLLWTHTRMEDSLEEILMPRNLRNFWIELDVDGYSKPVTRGPKSHSGGFAVIINVASHGDSRELLRISGMPLPNGKNRVIITLDRPLSAGEEVYNFLVNGAGSDRTLVIEEDRECKCIRAKDHER